MQKQYILLIINISHLPRPYRKWKLLCYTLDTIFGNRFWWAFHKKFVWILAFVSSLYFIYRIEKENHYKDNHLDVSNVGCMLYPLTYSSKSYFLWPSRRSTLERLQNAKVRFVFTSYFCSSDVLVVCKTYSLKMFFKKTVGRICKRTRQSTPFTWAFHATTNASNGFGQGTIAYSTWFVFSSSN